MSAILQISVCVCVCACVTAVVLISVFYVDTELQKSHERDREELDHTLKRSEAALNVRTVHTHSHTLTLFHHLCYRLCVNLPFVCLRCSGEDCESDDGERGSERAAERDGGKKESAG